MAPKSNQPASLDPKIAEQFDAYYNARRDKERREEQLDQAIPKPVREALQSIVSETLAAQLKEIFGPEGDATGDDTSTRRPPAEGDSSTAGFWGGLLGKRASGEE